MNSPSLDSGEELPHVNTQLFGILDEENRIKLWAEKSFKVPRDGPVPTMDGFLPGLASHFSTNFRRWVIPAYQRRVDAVRPARRSRPDVEGLGIASST
jgi:hypothetical protein